MELLSDRIQQLAESETIEMAKKARELAAKGIDVINLSFGEPDFSTPTHIKDAAKKALDDGFTFYTPVPGYPELRKAISDKFKRDNGLDYAPEQIVVSTGAKQSLANIFLCTINQGDEVIVFTPYWVSYRELIKLSGGTPVLVDGTIENDFKVNPEDLRIPQLFQRINSQEVKEVIMATNPNAQGQATAIYLTTKIKPRGIKITQLAHGLPMGGDIDYVDEVTLGKSLEGRREI